MSDQCFSAVLVDISLKSDIETMVAPIFALNKKKDTRQFIWHKNETRVVITPNRYGRATIWDKDILMYCIGQLMAAKNSGIEIKRVIQLTPNDLFSSTQKGSGGNRYKRLEDSLRRLRGTAIETNIHVEGLNETKEFSMIQSWRSIRNTKTGRLIKVEVVLSEWLFQQVLNANVLTYDIRYFKLTSSFERRLYEIFRKFCGNQAGWNISERGLYHYMGTKDNIRKFRFNLRKLEGKKFLHYRYSYKNKEIKVRRQGKVKRASE